MTYSFEQALDWQGREVKSMKQDHLYCDARLGHPRRVMTAEQGFDVVLNIGTLPELGHIDWTCNNQPCSCLTPNLVPSCCVLVLNG
jgi:hypothetical protein